MGTKRKWTKTRFPGVRYREHPTRKHGVSKDRYFSIRYQRDGKRIEEGLGWSSENWTAEKAAEELAALKRNARRGEGPTSLEEKRSIQRARKEEETKEKEEAEKNAVTFGDFFTETYSPIAERTKKADTVRTEKLYFKGYLEPVVGPLPFKDISPFHLERVKKVLLDKKRAPRTVQYCLAIFRQVWNTAKAHGLAFGDPPSKSVKVGKFDNKRVRFLTQEEAAIVLEAVKEKSEQVHDMALLSLHTGARAGEIFNLKWRGVDFENRVVTLLDTKAGGSRALYMTDEVEQMLRARKRGLSEEPVFTARNGERISEVSQTFQRVVDETGLNKGVTDRRGKITFHSLRHSFASWHAMAGTDIRVLQKLLGHHNIQMTMRYSHLSESALREATKGFQEALRKKVVKLRTRKRGPA
jgi:integrase